MRPREPAPLRPLVVAQQLLIASTEFHATNMNALTGTVRRHGAATGETRDAATHTTSPLTPPPREDDVLFNLAGLDVTMLHVYIVTGSALLAACVLLSVARAACALRSMCRRGRAAERPMVPTTSPSLGRPSDGDVVGSLDLWYHGVIASLERRAKSRITVSSLPDRARVGVIAVEMGSAPSSAASVQLRV